MEAEEGWILKLAKSIAARPLNGIIARCFRGIDGNCISNMNPGVAWTLWDDNGASLILNPESHSRDISICDSAFKVGCRSNWKFPQFLNENGLGEREPTPQSESKHPGADQSARDRNRSKGPVADSRHLYTYR